MLHTAEYGGVGDESESFALFLSTCRNIYLTINALFRDLRDIFGSIEGRDGVFGALQQLRGGAVASLDLEALTIAFAASDAKSDCWSRRDHFKQLLTEQIELLRERSRLDAQLVEEILKDVAIHEQFCDLDSIQQFLEIDVQEPDEMALLLKHIERTITKLRAPQQFLKHAKEINLRMQEHEAMNREPSLFPSDTGEINPFDAEKARMVRWVELITENKESNLVPAVCQERDWINRFLEADPETTAKMLLDLAADFQTETLKEYQEINKRFKPNIGKAPLPSAFLIDLSTQTPNAPSAESSTPASPHRFSSKRIRELQIAVAQPPFPSDLISLSTCRYRDDSSRTHAITWAESAVDLAVKSGCGLIVFPELFLPESGIDSLREFALRAGISVVTGIEGQWVDGLFSNSAGIWLAHERRDIRQYKRHPSNLEPATFFTKGGQQIFLNSSIGNFAVFLCSDFREFDIVAAVESQPFIDYLLVCCCNPYPDIWKHMAISDAARLHCYVVVSNWSEHRDSKGFGIGSFCASPGGKDAELIQDGAIVQVSIGSKGLAGSIAVFRLNFEALLHDREKPVSGYLPPPRRRLSIMPEESPN